MGQREVNGINARDAIDLTLTLGGDLQEKQPPTRNIGLKTRCGIRTAHRNAKYVCTFNQLRSM